MKEYIKHSLRIQMLYFYYATAWMKRDIKTKWRKTVAYVKLLNRYINEYFDGELK